MGQGRPSVYLLRAWLCVFVFGKSTTGSTLLATHETCPEPARGKPALTRDRVLGLTRLLKEATDLHQVFVVRLKGRRFHFE